MTFQASLFEPPSAPDPLPDSVPIRIHRRLPDRTLIDGGFAYVDAIDATAVRTSGPWVANIRTGATAEQEIIVSYGRSGGDGYEERDAVKLHRLIATRMLGRDLRAGEFVSRTAACKAGVVRDYRRSAIRIYQRLSGGRYRRVEK